MKPYPLCSYDISKDFTVGNLTKARLNGYVYGFLVDYNKIFTNICLEKHNIKYCLY